MIISISLIGCNDDLLNMEPLNGIPGQAVWSDPALMQANINNIYTGMGLGLFNSTSDLSVLTDNAMWTNGGQAVMQSTISPSDRGLLGSSRFDYLVWEDLYFRIRQTNVFLKKTANYSGSSPGWINRMRGEAHFLRAYYYHQLLRMYGGGPLITKVYGLKDQNTSVPRSTFKETVSFIVEDADSAATLLPLSYTEENSGRATKGAAMALKSRVLLHAASDLYNVNPSGMPETGYIDGDQVQRWQAARDAAKAVIDLGEYSLFRGNPAPGDSLAKNYSDLFLGKSNNEVIMYSYVSTKNDAPNIGRWCFPNGYGGWGENSPTQSLVDAYKMADGSEFNWNDPQEAAHPYENRDPRFYATILYDGAHWRERFPNAQGMDPEGIIQTFTKITLPDGSTLPGIDTREGPIQDWNGSYTHYYQRKFVNPDVNFRAIEQEVPWPHFRYAEILLNYAEASIELGEYNDARYALNKIRVRAGMPEFDTSVSGQELMSEYRNERRVEMVYEGQRFFDVRRWMVAPRVLDHPARGIKITVEGQSRADRSSYYDYKYTVVDVRPRSWDNKMYFAPISQDEMNRNDKLVQNPGY